MVFLSGPKCAGGPLATCARLGRKVRRFVTIMKKTWKCQTGLGCRVVEAERIACRLAVAGRLNPFVSKGPNLKQQLLEMNSESTPVSKRKLFIDSYATLLNIHWGKAGTYQVWAVCACYLARRSSEASDEDVSTWRCTRTRETTFWIRLLNALLQHVGGKVYHISCEPFWNWAIQLWRSPHWHIFLNGRGKKQVSSGKMYYVTWYTIANWVSLSGLARTVGPIGPADGTVNLTMSFLCRSEPYASPCLRIGSIRDMLVHLP